MTVSARVLDAVEAALSPALGRTPKQVNTIADTFSRDTVRHALRELVDSGRARYVGADCNRLYFLNSGQSS